MFVVVTTTGLFYSGKAGPSWLSPVKAEAFTYSAQEAARKCNSFNGMTPIHKLTFVVEAA